MDTTSELHILHFNDVYNVEERDQEPIGGAARFKTALTQLKKTHNALVVFSGDIFSPSILSTYFQGEHMMDFVETAQIDIACVGNHDFDFGVKKL